MKQVKYLKVQLLILTVCSYGLIHCQSDSSQNGETKSIRTLIVGGGSSHDFNRWYKGKDKETLEKDGLATVVYTDRTDSIHYYLPDMDVLYLSNNQPIENPEVRKAIFDFISSGKGLVLGHASLWYNWSDWPEYNAQLVGGGSRGHDPYGSFEVTVTQTDHPITQGVPKNFTLKDELYYYKEDSVGSGIEVLATASNGNTDSRFPSVFVVNHEKARIVGLALGHDEESHNLPAYQDLLRNAVKWAAAR